MAETRIKMCTCKHEYQDSKYGKQKRVHNKMVTATGAPEKAKCTVCETIN